MGRGDALASGEHSAQFTAPNVTEQEFEERVGKRPRKKQRVEEPAPITTSAFGVKAEAGEEYVPDVELTREDGNVFWAGETGFEAAWNQIIVLQDEWRSGLECPTCMSRITRNFDGKDLSVIQCPECGGKGQRPKAGNEEIMVRCSECDGRGDIVCPDCNGKGATIVTPETSKSEPTTGRIVSIGPEAEGYSLGDRVMYMNYSGNLYRLAVRSKITSRKVEVALRIIVDRDIRCKLHGYINAKELRAAYALHTNE